MTPAECVINVSEGRDVRIIESLRHAGDPMVLDLHSDLDHHRSVLTLGGPLEAVEEAARRVAADAVDLIDLRLHDGVHPRLGALDVVPFVPIAEAGIPPADMRRCLDARDRFARWVGSELAVPCFLYGPERSLPEVRRSAFRSLRPDTGPPTPHPTAGASAVGARAALVAYNVWISSTGGLDPDRPSVLSVARDLAAGLRGSAVRSLGLPIGADAQVSFNLLEPTSVTVADLYDAVSRGAESEACSVVRAELVGLLPMAALRAVPRHRWAELDLSEDRTIEHRLDTSRSPTARRDSGTPEG
jgi:glutamate formiminotransferase / 5-formyltetrahydrofolate cyclo-ligase